MSKLGIITIGQSPRIDLTEDLIGLLNEKIDIVERGVLDKYTYEEVVDEFSPKSKEKILVSRMRDGRQVILSEKKIIDSMQNAIVDLEKNVDIVLILCTGKFPEYIHNKPLLVPQEIVHSLVSKLYKKKEVGLIVPDENQIKFIRNWWKEAGLKTYIKSASPYKDINDIKKVSKDFKNKDIDYIVLDCMGYSKEMKEIVKINSGKIVVLPRTLIVRIINELIG